MLASGDAGGRLWGCSLNRRAFYLTRICQESRKPGEINQVEIDIQAASSVSDHAAGLRVIGWSCPCRILCHFSVFCMMTASPTWRRARARPFQEACRLKYELSAELPGSAGGSLAVASFNLHQATMANAYGITLDQGTKMHSGCIGYGFERFCFAFIAQHGLDPENWPPYVRDRIEGACGNRENDDRMALQGAATAAVHGG